MNLEYRLAEPTECATLAALRWQSRIEEDGERARTPRTDFERECAGHFRRGMESGALGIWVAVEDGVIVSHIVIRRVPLVPRPWKVADAFGHVTNAYTRPEHRSKGIGTTLMRHAVEWARTEDLELLIVWPSLRAVPYYRRLGFASENEVLQLTLRPYYENEPDPGPSAGTSSPR